jgi:hypothetical protein
MEKIPAIKEKSSGIANPFPFRPITAFCAAQAFFSFDRIDSAKMMSSPNGRASLMYLIKCLFFRTHMPL